MSISHRSCETIWTDILGMKFIFNCLHSKMLNFQHKQNRKNITEQLLADIADVSELIKHVITDDEIWVQLLY